MDERDLVKEKRWGHVGDNGDLRGRRDAERKDGADAGDKVVGVDGGCVARGQDIAKESGAHFGELDVFDEFLMAVGE